MITLYGIPNCDTVKKARAWLASHGVEVAFHDYKKLGVPQAEHFMLTDEALPQAGSGEVRVRNHWLSVEPAMPRGQSERAILVAMELAAS